MAFFFVHHTHSIAEGKRGSFESFEFLSTVYWAEFDG